MKSYIAVFLVFLLIASIVLAGSGKMTNLDFSKEPLYIYRMFENDGVKFNMLGGDHIIIVDNIKDKGVDLQIHPYYKNYEANVNYVTLNDKAALKLDLDKNGVRDLKVSLAQIYPDKSVKLVFEQINETYINNLTGRVLNPSPKKFYQDKNFIIAGVVGLVLLIVILSLILRKKRK